MNSIGSAHAVYRAPPSFSPVTTPDRILFIIGNFPEYGSGQWPGRRRLGINLSFVRVADHTDGGVIDIPGAMLLDAWTCRLAIQTEKSVLMRVWPMLVTRRRSYQFPAGLSMWSITNVSTGPFAGSNFRPSSSWSAANIEPVGSDAGELPSAGCVGRRGENLVPSRENSIRISNRPAIPVLLNTGRPKIAKSILEKSSSVVP